MARTKKKENPVKKNSGRVGWPRPFASLDENRRKMILKFCGLMTCAFAVFTLISIVSYLFTWKEDQSVLSVPIAVSDVHNGAGQLGCRWGYFLVSRCFGLGSFAFFLLLAAISLRLLFGKRKTSLLKSFAVTVSGAVIFSVLFAFAGSLAGVTNAFGGGLGGDCGAAISAWSCNLVGKAVTLILILIFIVGWLMFTSRRFSGWLVALFDRKHEASRKKDWVSPESESETESSPEDPETDVVPASDMDEDELPHGGGEDFCPEAGENDFSGREDESALYPEDEPGVEQEDETEVEPEVKPEDEAAVEPEDEVADGRYNVQDEEAGDGGEQDGNDGLEVIKTELSTDVRADLPRINVRDELENFRFPGLDLLDDYPDGRHEVSQEELEMNNNKIRATLLSYKIQIEKVFACVGPTVTLYKIIPAKGVKISAIKNLDEDIALALGVKDVRIVTLEDAVGIEVANKRPSIVPLKFMLNDDSFRNNRYELPVAIGVTITNKVKVFDLADAPHLLVAGATKQGKSVCLNVIITSLLYSKHPSELKFVFIDPKRVEFTLYSSLIHHYLAVLPDAVSEKDEMDNAIVKKPKQAEMILKSLCIEMDERYDLLSNAEVRNVKDYNNKYMDRHLLPTDGHKYMPYIVVVIDEYADLIMASDTGGESKSISKNIMDCIIRLAQKGRAAGIHLILATQRPSTNVVTGLIKGNFPTRIAFRVSQRMDSMVILDSTGAEKLIGRGDMLYFSGIEMERVQCAFVDKEIKPITRFIGSQTGYRQAYSVPYYLPEPPSSDGDSQGVEMIDMQNVDALFEEASKIVVLNQIGSTSTLQRKLGIGYARAGRIMDQLEAAGIVGPQEGSKPRLVLVPDYETLQPILKAYLKPDNQ